MQRSLLKGFYLQDLLIEPTSGRVSGPDRNTHLKPTAIEVLLFLAERPFELVERKALLRAVWGEDQGSPEALNHAIGELRSGLGDNADDPQLIQTVPTRGYRLLRKPRLVDGPESDPVPEVADEGSFVGSLMRRGVVQAGIAYLIFSWLLIQVADAVTPILGLPAWFPPFITYSAIGGIPVVLVLAWLLEQSGGHWSRDRGKQSGHLLSGLERNYLSILVAYVIAATGASTYQVFVGFDVPATNGVAVAEEDILLPVRPNSIAVLKFLNINDDNTARAFSDGLGEDILDRLARIPGLSVSSRGDSWSLPDNASSDVVRKRLRVAYFLEGSVRLIGDDLRVVVQLIESATGFHVFSRSFDSKARDHMSVQREITNLAVANLRIALPEDSNNEYVSSDIDPDLDAYVLYRRGKALLDGPPGVDSINQAIELFEKALAIDPEYSAAHAGVCRAHVSSYELDKNDAGIDMAEAACRAALISNPNLDEVYTALGTLRLSTGDLQEADVAYRRALEMNPQDVHAMRGIASILESDQQFDEAERMLQLAINLQPGNWRNILALGGLYYYSGRYTEAAHAYRQVVFLDPGNWVGHGNLGNALMMTGDFDAAVEPLNTSLKIERDVYYLSALGTIYYYLGDYDRSANIQQDATELLPEANFAWLNLGDALRFSSRPEMANGAYREAIARSADLLKTNPTSAFDVYVQAWATAATGDEQAARHLLERALELAPGDPNVHYYDGLLKFRRGDMVAAIKALRSAVDMGYPVAMLAADPLLGDLRSDDRFARLIGKNHENQ